MSVESVIIKSVVESGVERKVSDNLPPSKLCALAGDKNHSLNIKNGLIHH